MDMERVMKVVDGLFQGRDEVSREEVLDSIHRADIDEESRRAMSALVREKYTQEELIHELRGLGRDVPLGLGGGAG